MTRQTVNGEGPGESFSGETRYEKPSVGAGLG